MLYAASLSDVINTETQWEELEARFIPGRDLLGCLQEDQGLQDTGDKVMAQHKKIERECFCHLPLFRQQFLPAKQGCLCKDQPEEFQ